MKSFIKSRTLNTSFSEIQVDMMRILELHIPKSYFHLCLRMFDVFSTEELPYLKCPLHTVLKLTPVAYGRFALHRLSNHHDNIDFPA